MTHPLRGTFVGNSIVRLADEGVPIGALSRTFKIPYDSAHGIVRQAMEDGVLVEMPAADWPVGARLRKPTTTPIRLRERPDFALACKAAFGLTAAESRLLNCLLRARACTRPHLQAVVAPDAGPKIIDVFVCKIRGKIRCCQARIDTIWGQGYAMSEESKRQVLARIGGPS